MMGGAKTQNDVKSIYVGIMIKLNVKLLS